MYWPWPGSTFLQFESLQVTLLEGTTFALHRALAERRPPSEPPSQPPQAGPGLRPLRAQQLFELGVPEFAELLVTSDAVCARFAPATGTLARGPGTPAPEGRSPGD